MHLLYLYECEALLLPPHGATATVNDGTMIPHGMWFISNCLSPPPIHGPRTVLIDDNQYLRAVWCWCVVVTFIMGAAIKMANKGVTQTPHYLDLQIDEPRFPYHYPYQAQPTFLQCLSLLTTVYEWIDLLGLCWHGHSQCMLCLRIGQLCWSDQHLTVLVH